MKFRVCLHPVLRELTVIIIGTSLNVKHLFLLEILPSQSSVEKQISWPYLFCHGMELTRVPFTPGYNDLFNGEHASQVRSIRFIFRDCYGIHERWFYYFHFLLQLQVLMVMQLSFSWPSWSVLLKKEANKEESKGKKWGEENLTEVVSVPRTGSACGSAYPCTTLIFRLWCKL